MSLALLLRLAIGLGALSVVTGVDRSILSFPEDDIEETGAFVLEEASNLLSDTALDRLAGDVSCARVGATQNPRRRLSEYRREGDIFFEIGVRNAIMYFAYYPGNGTMGYMKSQEQDLLDIALEAATCPLNEQLRSNYANKYESGYLYVIVDAEVYHEDQEKERVGPNVSVVASGVGGGLGWWQGMLGLVGTFGLVHI